jgi:hypothetical protein
MSEILPGIRDALEAMNRGDVESAVSLLDPEVEWRGPTRGTSGGGIRQTVTGPIRPARTSSSDEGQTAAGAATFRLEQAEQIGAARADPATPRASPSRPHRLRHSQAAVRRANWILATFIRIAIAFWPTRVAGHKGTTPSAASSSASASFQQC